jgi:hypothetical protein
MTLAPRKPIQTPKVFSTYDLEWHPETQKFRMAGVFDGTNYRCYASMSEFLTAELVPENFGRIFFAHNGGKSDLHFILHELLATGLCSANGMFEMDCSFNGSSAFLCHLRMRDNPKNSFTFADTLFLLKASLKKIGEWIGMSKGEVAFDTDNWNELRDYNELDCRVLHKAVTDLERELFEMGGEIKLTLASSAMALFQTHYLQSPLVTLSSVNDLARHSYYASRVEVFTRTCDRALYYDVNSSFPWSMTQSLPGKFLGQRTQMMTKPQGARHFMVEATIKIKDCYLPPVPYRDADNRILFPTGQWRGWFTDIDLHLLEKEGHQVVKVHVAYWFEEFRDLTLYVVDLYEKKANAKGFKREVYKLLLNSLYGKFAETEFKQKLLIHPVDISCPHKPEHKDRSCIKALPMLGLYTREDHQELQHVHVPLSAWITSYSRGLLYRCLSRCKRIYYTDTDSIVCGEDDVFPNATEAGQTIGYVGDDVGQLKLEQVITKGEFAAPKLYMLEAHEPGKKDLPSDWWSPDNSKKKIVVKSKGFNKLDGTSFQQLVSGEAVTLKRMSGIKENIRKQNTTPRDVRVPKFARFKRTKRADDGNEGETRPWTIRELEEQAS